MRIKTAGICMLVLIAFASTVFAGDRKGKMEDYTKHPGYVDFNVMEIFGDKEPKVEVSLKQPMLKLVSEFTKNEDPELFNMLGKLAVVRVYVFEADEKFTKKFDDESSKAIKILDGKGWERVVRVSEDDELVYIYLKPSKDYDFIEGIVVLAIEEDGEAVFVNIAGEIHPDDINSLGEHFGIEELDGIPMRKKDKD
jgi:hypothetical protein